MGIVFGEKEKEHIAVGMSKLKQAIEQYELEYGKMTPSQSFIFIAGYNAGIWSIRGIP